MKVIFAQGNPEKQYERTRHNVGFTLLDTLATEKSLTWQKNTKFNADLAEYTENGEKVLLVKPLSYYNETGQVARAIVDFYKLTPSRDVLVLHDELALPFGTIRVREKGSDAGNNGIKSLNAHLGQGYWRIRIGIWNERRDKVDDAHFVLSAFTADEAAALRELTMKKLLPLIADFTAGNLQTTSHTA